MSNTLDKCKGCQKEMIDRTDHYSFSFVRTNDMDPNFSVLVFVISVCNNCGYTSINQIKYKFWTGQIYRVVANFDLPHSEWPMSLKNGFKNSDPKYLNKKYNETIGRYHKSVNEIIKKIQTDIQELKDMSNSCSQNPEFLSRFRDLVSMLETYCCTDVNILEFLPAEVFGFNDIPPAPEGLNEEGKEIYTQAKEIFANSPKAAACLLRSVLESFLKEKLLSDDEKKKDEERPISLHTVIEKNKSFLYQKFHGDEKIYDFLLRLKDFANNASHSRHMHYDEKNAEQVKIMFTIVCKFVITLSSHFDDVDLTMYDDVNKHKKRRLRERIFKKYS